MKTKKATCTILICSILLFFLLSTSGIAAISSAQRTGRTLYVCSNGSTRFSSIQHAIQNARDGDTIYIHNGTYHENIQITKSITIIGEHKQSTIIQPSQQHINYIIYISADNVTISGLTIQSSKQNLFTAALLLDNTENITIQNNTIQHCQKGIVLWQNTTNTTIYNNNFINNSLHIYHNDNPHFFNSSYPVGGNYWGTFKNKDNYKGSQQNIFGSDGIYDTPYHITDCIHQDFYAYVHKDGWLHTAPLASMNGPYMAYINQAILFDASKSKASSGEVSYQWDFGDNNKGQGKICSHTYTKPGTYTISLTVTDTYTISNTVTSYAYIWDTTQGEQSIPSTFDTFISEKNKNQSYGSQTMIQVSPAHRSNTSDTQHHALIYFDLSCIPHLIEINHAEVMLYYYRTDSNTSSNRNLSLRKITSQWYEHNVTWITKPSNSTINSSIASVPEEFGWIRWNVTNDILSFVNGNETNVGWMIMDLEYWNENNTPMIWFKSRETITAYQPVLRISYSTPLVAVTSKIYEAAAGEYISFNGLYIGDAKHPLLWEWDFGEGSISNHQNPVFKYDTSGKYLITLSITDSAGKTSTCTATVFITQKNTDCFYISSPDAGFYLFNNKITSLKNTFVIGDIDIVVDGLDSNHSIEKIEFYCNNNLMYTGYEIPFIYRWKKQSLLPFRNAIKVIAYDSNGLLYSHEFFVFRFF